MKLTKENFKNSWNNSIKNYAKNNELLTEKPEVMNLLTAWEDITKAGPATAYNATIAQNGYVDDYSYEEGYFQAFKIITYCAKEDSDSLVMPAMFVARHLIELTLKDLIFNLSIIFGELIKIEKENTHNLSDIYDDLCKISKRHNLTRFYESKFSKIICQMKCLSPKSDEFRYPTNPKGEWNFNNRSSEPHLINLVALDHDITYFYIVTQSLLILISNSSDSIYEDTVYDNPYLIELIKILKNKKESMRKIKDNIIGLIDSSKLPLDKDKIGFKKIKTGIEVDYKDMNLFTVIVQNESIYLKTKGLIN